MTTAPVGAIEVRVGAARFTCATVEEAVALARALGAIPSGAAPHRHGEGAPTEPVASPRSPGPPPEELRSGGWRQPWALDVYWGRLDPRGREAIRAIATSEGLSIDQLRDRLGLTSTKHVSQVLAACKRVAEAAGIHDSRDVFTFTLTGARGHRVTRYYPGRLLRGAEAEPCAAAGRADEHTAMPMAESPAVR